MKILLIHNRYKIKGGEDTVFDLETELVRQNGQEVETLEFTNDEINGALGSIATAVRSFYNSSSAKLLKEKIASFQPDIIHIHNFFPVGSPSLFYVARKMGVPVVMTLHNYRLICPSAILYYDGKVYEDNIHKIFPLKAVLKGVYRNSVVATFSLVAMTGFHKLVGTWKNKVTRYITLSEFARQKFIHSSAALGESQLVVKPNFAFDAGVGTEKEDYYLFAGRLSEEKGLSVLVKAFMDLPYPLVIAGSGPLLPEVEALLANNPQVTYLGLKNSQEIRDLMKKAKALVFPSVCYEGMPMTIIEAFSTGTPVIASKMGAMVEMIVDGEHGYHFEAGSPAALQTAIKKFEEKGAEYAAISQKCRTRYLERYTPERNVEQLIQIYQDAIKPG